MTRQEQREREEGTGGGGRQKVAEAKAVVLPVVGSAESSDKM